MELQVKSVDDLYEATKHIKATDDTDYLPLLESLSGQRICDSNQIISARQPDVLNNICRRH